MSNYIFITDEVRFETLTMVSAETIEEAKTKYSEEVWQIVDFLLEDVETKTVNASFWEEYFLDLVSNEDGSWLYEIDEIKKLFKANLEKDFSPKIAKELLNYFFDREKSIEELTDKARIDIAKVQVQKLLDDNFLRIYSLDEMRSIS